jgi:O-antigen ligase
MKFKRGFVISIIVALVLSLLLTPLGFETRPLSTVIFLGNLGLDAYLVGAILSVVSLVLVLRKNRFSLAATSGIAGQILFLPIILLDLTGNYSMLPPPQAIPPTEVATILASLTSIYIGLTALRRRNSLGSRTKVPSQVEKQL